MKVGEAASQMVPQWAPPSDSEFTVSSRFLQRFEEVQIAVGVVEDREIDEARAVVLHQQIVGVLAPADTPAAAARAAMVSSCVGS